MSDIIVFMMVVCALRLTAEFNNWKKHEACDQRKSIKERAVEAAISAMNIHSILHKDLNMYCLCQLMIVKTQRVVKEYLVKNSVMVSGHPYSLHFSLSSLSLFL
jgi:hypothetical protein